MAITNTFANSIVALRGVTPADEGSTVRVVNYYDQTAGSPFNEAGGGGLYRWDPGSTEQPNQGSVIAPFAAWNSGPKDWDSGRWLLVHDGVVTVRQFGATGAIVPSLKTLADLVTLGLFLSTDEALATYKAIPGNPFCGLDDTDTFDWCAIQASLIWCGIDGVRCEAPEGVYLCSRPIWLGDEATSPDNENGGKIVNVMGLTFAGQTGNSRTEIDGGVANIRLTTDCTNRYCLSTCAVPLISTFRLKGRFGYDEFITDLTLSFGSDADDVKAALDDAFDDASMDFHVELITSGGTLIADENVYFRVVPDTDPETPAFLGEILAIESGTSEFTNWVHCFPDSAVISYRRSAAMQYRLENLNLKGNLDNGNRERNASFGFLFVTTQNFGHIIEKVEMSYVDTAVGILQGTGANGEQFRVDRLHAQETRRMLYTNAPQAFGHEFIGWNGHLQNVYKENESVEDRDLTGLVYAEFDEIGTPGYGANFYNAGATFSVNQFPENDGTMVLAKRGTGVIQFIGGRVEHMARLFHYDALSEQGIENNMDFIFKGMEFTVVGGGDRKMVQGDQFDDSDNKTQYGLFVENCTFQSVYNTEHPEYGDLVFESLTDDNLRSVFEHCRFLGIRSLKQRVTNVAFHNCYKNDFVGSGMNNAPLREMYDQSSTPGLRMQSLRNAWDDTPWNQTGQRVNILRNADFDDQTFSATPMVLGGITATFASPWVLESSVTGKILGFGKWGAYGTSSEVANISPSADSFYMALPANSKLWQPFDETDHEVDLSIDGPKICTYQGLCRVKGSARFALVRCIDGALDLDTVYDEVVVDSADFTSPTLINLTAQIEATETVEGDDPHPYVALLVESIDTLQWQVYWHHVWASERLIVDNEPTDYVADKGIIKTAFVRTPANVAEGDDFAWGLTSLSIKAASRLQMPNLEPIVSETTPLSVGWRNPYDNNGDYDLVDGEIYWDVKQQGVVCRMSDGWYMLSQPERLMVDPADDYTWVAGNAKNVVYTVGTGRDLILDTSVANIVPGTIVRVAWLKTGIVSGNVIINFGGAANVSLAATQAAEFVFYNDGGTGKWLVTQANVSTKI